MSADEEFSRESSRLLALQRYGVLDSGNDKRLDDLTALAASIFDAPVALISFVAESHERPKSAFGWSFDPIARDISFCARTILEPAPLIVPDASLDLRFADNPLVVGEPNVRFYAGARLLTVDGDALGAICVIDRVPRELASGQLAALRTLSRQVMAVLDLNVARAALAEQLRAEEHVRRLNRVYSVLGHVNQNILRQQAVAPMLSSACDIAVRHGGFRMAWAGLIEPRGGPLNVAAHAGATDDTVRLITCLLRGAPKADCSVTMHALQAGTHGVCNDIEHDPRSENWRSEALSRGYRAMAALPLTVRGIVCGTFNLYAEEVGFFDAEVLRLLDELAFDISFALEVHERDRERRAMEDALRHGEQRFRELAADQRALEDQLQQAQKLEAIGQLAGGVAHDFNNILTVIQGFGSFLTMETLSPEAAEAAEQIVKAAERASNLTRQLLAFGRRQVMQPRDLDLNDIVRGLNPMLQRILGDQVRLAVQLSPVALAVRADAGMLEQVLLNLVVNARDAMPKDGTVRIETFASALPAEATGEGPALPPGHYVGVRVSDSGDGIAPEDLPHIFEPFFTTKGPGKGTGLGLATVYGIVTQHRGTLRVQSVPGGGTTIEMWLPAVATAAAMSADPELAPAPRRGDETILVVEDDSHVRALTRAILERHGYRVLEAAHGPEAMRVWETCGGAVDLLLTDLVMPEGMSGRELATRLLRVKSQLRVVYMSGYSPDMAGRELSEAERQCFIQKPASPRDILQTVRQCLDGSGGPRNSG